AGDWDRVEAMLARIDALRHAFPDHQDIALQEAMAAVNVTKHAGKAGDWDRVEAALNRLKAGVETLVTLPGFSAPALRGAALGIIFGPAFEGSRDWQRWAGQTALEILARHSSALEPEEVGLVYAILKAARQLFPEEDWLQPALEAAEDAGFDWDQIPDLPSRESPPAP
ncbi:MAG: hypothetical protein KDA53_15320, partial [Hyphomonas sp.]|nr:hypothetical protein [Hyphomonas sp.]